LREAHDLESNAMKPKIILIDGNSLLHRAYHALPPLSTASGAPTNATLGFTNMLLKLLQDQKPDLVIAAFDAPGKTFRHELFKQYKAQRPPTPGDLLAQFGDAKEVLEALGVPQVEVPGYEGEDIIAALAREGVQKGFEALIVTGDRDVLQLASDDITVMATLRGISDVHIYDADEVRKQTGLRPEQIPDFKGLAGDPSDNIPGVPGVGDKTAVRLLQQFGSLEEILAHADQIQPERIRKAIVKHAELARLGKELATIASDAPVKLPPLPAEGRTKDLRRLRAVLARLEFHNILKQLPVDDDSRWQAEYRIVRESTGIAELIEQIRKCKHVGMGIAWAGERPTAARIVGVAWATAPGQASFVPASLWLDKASEETQQTDLFAETASAPPAQGALIRQLLQDPEIHKCSHDFKEQAVALALGGMTLDGDSFDSLLASYVCSPGRSDHSPGRLVLETLGYVKPEPDELGQLLAGELAAGEDATCVSSACFMADASLRLYEPLMEQVRARGQEELLEEIEMPTARVLAEMESRGIAVDRQKLSDLSERMQQEIEQLSSRIWEIAGERFNIDSPKQLATVLFDELGLKSTRKTKTGRSTSAEVLEALAQEHEIARLILEYRTFTKLKSTYADALGKLVNPRTGRVHTRFNQAVTATGRLSSSDPNLQNIPARGEWGRRIRGCFVAGQEGWSLLSVDYSQIELRVLAHVCNDERLVRAFREGLDIHVATACDIFDVPPEKVTPLMRDQAKTVNFAVIYGMGPAALAAQLGISRDEAEKFINDYFKKLPGVRRYIERTIETARQEGVVTTLLGRRREVAGLNSDNPRQRHAAERIAVNTPIQGTAADIMKLAMLRVHDELSRSGSPAAILLNVHDELLFEAPDEHIRALAATTKEALENAYQLEVPLKAEAKAGKNWAEMEPVRL